MKIRRILALVATTLLPSFTSAQEVRESPFELYGFVQLDFIQDFDRVHPDWKDTLRPTRIPTQRGQYGDDGETIFGIRNTRFGARGNVDVDGAPLRTVVEFELFGTGADAGKTTPRLRHAYGEWRSLLAGQTWSAFMDVDVFPAVLDKWGPNGLVLLRNPQIRWTPLSGSRTFCIAIEKPASDIDIGVFANVDPVLGANIRPHSDAPDLTAHYRASSKRGHVQLAAIVRPSVGFESPGQPGNAPKGNERGWGVNATALVNLSARDRLLAGVVYGAAIGTYLNDGGTDIGPDGTLDRPHAAAVRRHGSSLYYERTWSPRWRSVAGYSESEVRNLRLQTEDAFHRGRYASLDVTHLPAKNVTIGSAVLWAERRDAGGASGRDLRVQLSFRYAFSNRL